jgi:hypothetical protein
MVMMNDLISQIECYGRRWSWEGEERLEEVIVEGLGLSGSGRGVIV